MPLSPFSGHGRGPVSRTHRPFSPQDDGRQYGALQASLLYCPKCQTATPARERLLLVLPTGNLYEYLCAHCGTSTGEKTDQEKHDVQLFIP
jgi:hypothetical protein